METLPNTCFSTLDIKINWKEKEVLNMHYTNIQVLKKAEKKVGYCFPGCLIF